MDERDDEITQLRSEVRTLRSQVGLLRSAFASLAIATGKLDMMIEVLERGEDALVRALFSDASDEALDILSGPRVELLEMLKNIRERLKARQQD
jgi:hypothetical protein